MSRTPTTPQPPGSGDPSSDRPAGRPYVRTMHGWWRRDPFFTAYMVREFTALAVLAYAVLLAAGAVALAQGPDAWVHFAGFLRAPASVALHLVLLWAMWLHGKTWFEILPKTIPYVYAGGRRVPAAIITRLGWAAAIGASVILLGMVAWTGAQS